MSAQVKTAWLDFPLPTLQVEYFQAHAVFVLASETIDPQQADEVALLTAKSLKSAAPWVPVHLTLQLPSSSVHRWADWDHLVCAQVKF